MGYHVDGQHLGRFHASLGPPGGYHRSAFLAVADMSWAGARRGERPPCRAPHGDVRGRRGQRRRERSATQQASGTKR
jgi:hypothetical protein